MTTLTNPDPAIRGVLPANPAEPAAEADLRLDTRPVESERDILDRYRGNAIGELLASQNLGHVLPVTPSADLLVVTCMDHRVTLDIPERFAFQLRTAGANPMPVLSNIAFAVGVAGVRAISVVAHTDCAMCRVDQSADAMTRHLVEREGWDFDEARKQHIKLQRKFRIDDPIRAAWSHANTLAARFPSCLVAPLLFRVEDGALLQIERGRDVVLGGIQRTDFA